MMVPVKNRANPKHQTALLIKKKMKGSVSNIGPPTAANALEM